MFPQLSLSVGEIGMKQPGEAVSARAGRPLGVSDEECGFCSRVSGGPVGGAAAGPRQGAAGSPRSRKGLRSTVGDVGCDRERTSQGLWK